MSAKVTTDLRMGSKLREDPVPTRDFTELSNPCSKCRKKKPAQMKKYPADHETLLKNPVIKMFNKTIAICFYGIIFITLRLYKVTRTTEFQEDKALSQDI